VASEIYSLGITAMVAKTRDNFSINCKFYEIGKDAGENKNERGGEQSGRVKYYQMLWRKGKILLQGVVFKMI
jgi:hypothetical protein